MCMADGLNIRQTDILEKLSRDNVLAYLVHWAYAYSKNPKGQA